MPDTLTTPNGTPYLSFNERIAGDPVRAFTPTRLRTEARVLWLIHAFGSSHDAILGGYSAVAQTAIDAGWVVVCPNLGGSLWSSPRAQQHLRNTHTELTERLAAKGVRVVSNVMLGTSHGGCLATYATGRNLIPNITGLYLINGVYDAYNRDGAYGIGMRLSYMLAGGTSSTNPASIPATAFNVPVRVCYDPTDPTVSARGNGALFASRLERAGRLHSVRVHNSEHSTPPGTAKDVALFLGSL